MTPDDPIPHLEERLAALHALGPVEYDPGEREAIEQLLAEQDRISRAAMQKLDKQFQRLADYVIE
jgi:hypothetical protein